MKPTKIQWHNRLEDGFKFDSTGRVFRSYHNYTFDIGGDDEISGGYDDMITGVEDEEEDYTKSKFLPEEKKEIAEYMIQKWKEWGGIE